MKTLLLTLLTIFAIQTMTFGQQETKKFKTILLFEDGSWRYADSIPSTNNIKKDEQTSFALTQCKGTNIHGVRCDITTASASGYCGLHESQIPKNSKSSKPEVKKAENQTGTTPTGLPIFTGPRGGQYHYSKSGNKVYQKKK